MDTCLIEVIERKVIDKRTQHSKVKIDGLTINLKSIFDGDKSLNDALFNLVVKKINTAES